MKNLPIKLMILLLIISLGGLAGPSKSFAGTVDLAEYLRLEVISKTLYKRSKTNPDWDMLIRPNWSEFKTGMQAFVLSSVENRNTKAMAPAGYMGATIAWDKLKPTGAAVDFDEVPDPWFNLQADIINQHIILVEEAFAEDELDQEKITGYFSVIKDAILAWPRPPFKKMR